MSTPADSSAETPPVDTRTSALSVSTGDLAFVLEVLIPRVWVRGAEVDALVELRAKLEAVLEEVDRGASA